MTSPASPPADGAQDCTAAFAALADTQPREGRPAFRVAWAGSQRDLMANDLRAKADLRPLASRRHVWGLGPAERLCGEITVFDSQPHVVVVQQGGLCISHEWPSAAPFFVHAQVVEWIHQDLPQGLDLPALERGVALAAAAAGIDVGQPFPFRVTGVALHLGYHVQNKTDELPHSAQEHLRTMAHFKVALCNVELLGFHSHQHRGVFTPPASSVHVHVRTADDRHGGHVDELQLSAGCRLLLPRL